MKYGVVLGGLCALVLAAGAPAKATEATCRSAAASKVSAFYVRAGKTFAKCSKAVAAGKACDTDTRDARVTTAGSKLQTTLLTECDDPTATGLGFPTNDALVVRIVGTAAGEGRQAADSVYGRDATLLGKTTGKCAAAIVKRGLTAARTQLRVSIPCGSTCDTSVTNLVDSAYANASAQIARACSPADLNALVAGDLAGHLAAVRADADGVVAAFHPGAGPVVSLASPAPGTILTPPGLPANVALETLVANVPHASYVNSVTVNGFATTFDAGTGRFDRTLSL